MGGACSTHRVSEKCSGRNM